VSRARCGVGAVEVWLEQDALALDGADPEQVEGAADALGAVVGLDERHLADH
jgi:hypothetical protein